PVDGEGPALPDALLALPERLSALQAQVAALQQQVTDLTCLLGQHTLKPVSLSAPAKPSRRSKRSPKLAPSATATTPRKPVHVIPRVEYGEQGHYVVICPKHGLLPLEPDTPEWFAWVAKQSSFRFVGRAGSFRSEEHTSELQSRSDLVCRLLLEKKKKKNIKISVHINRNNI